MKRINLHPLFNLIIYLLSVIVLGGLLATLLLVTINLPLAEYAVSSESALWWLIAAVELIILIVGLICLTILLEQHHTGEKLGWKRLISVNMIRNTYIQYVWVSLTISPLLLLSLESSETFKRLIEKQTGLQITSSTNIYLAVLLSLCFIAIFVSSARHEKEKVSLRFSPGSTEEDEFGYRQIAADDMQSLINTKRHIIIATINGRMGEGKSSYLRMMVNSRPQSEMLYTYISLTETNEAKSFSKLFAERWLDTLISRYPSASHTAKQSILDNIFRESGNGLLKSIGIVMGSSRWPFRRTPIKYSGDNYPELKYANSTIAPLFSYVSDFQENYWVVVIDEIERSRFDEIYRVIETLERFRMEAQWGLPIKLIFVLCIDRIRLNERVAEDPQTEEASLVYSFLEREPKTVDVHIDLPPVPPDKKQAFILTREKDWLIDKYGIDMESVKDPDTNEQSLEIYWSKHAIDTSEFIRQQGVIDDKKAHDWMMHKLMPQSPRAISKIIEQTDYLLGRFTRSYGDGKAKANRIRLSDLIMLNYLKFKYPIAVKFLARVHPVVFPDYYGFKGDSMDAIFMNLSTRRNAQKVKFDDFFKANVDEAQAERLSQAEINEIHELVMYLCYPIIEYIDAIGNENAHLRYEEDNKASYDHTLALPENFQDILTASTDTQYNASDFLKTQQLLGTVHELGRLPDNLLNDAIELLRFSRNLRRFYPREHLTSWYLAQQIAHMLIDTTIVERLPGSLARDTTYADLTYQFTFHFAEYLARDEIKSADVTTGFGLIRDVLSASTVMLEAKIKILDSLLVYSHSGQSETAIDLDRTLKKLEEAHSSELKKLASEVVMHGLDQYLPTKSGKSIYDYEENYFYVLYQLWSGDPADTEGIEKIRKVAKNGLGAHPDVIDAFWNLRFTQGRIALLDNPELPIKLDDLIQITEAAGKMDEHKAQLEGWRASGDKTKTEIRPAGLGVGDTTVRLQLTKRGYIS